MPEAGDIKMLDVDDLDGAFVKTLTEASGTVSVTYQAGDNSADTLTFTVGTGGGLDEAAVDARVNVVAADACVEIDYAGSTLTCTQLDGGTDAVTIATTGTTDGVVDGGSVSGDTLTLTRTESLADVTIQTGFATDAEVDGVFDSALFSNRHSGLGVRPLRHGHVYHPSRLPQLHERCATGSDHERHGRAGRYGDRRQRGLHVHWLCQADGSQDCDSLPRGVRSDRRRSR